MHNFGWRSKPSSRFSCLPWSISRPTFEVKSPNVVHQADLLFLPHNRLPRGKKVYKYALIVVDVTSRFKTAEPLTSKAFQAIFNCGPLRCLKVLQGDPRHEFMGNVTREMTKRDMMIRRRNVNIHRDQRIIKRLNQTLGECLFTFQYSQEMNFKEGKRSTWSTRGFQKLF